MEFLTAFRMSCAGLLSAMTAGCMAAGVAVSDNANAQSLPPIRLTSANRVPACVTPNRLMQFLEQQNPDLPPKLQNIARYYREHGERLGVRWDYAFFQMIVETNYLKFRNNRGQGDVRVRQNNFAGIGTIGGGVPGDSFPDVSTGVLAQMQHLIAYSGEYVDQPVARRTREKQEHIVSLSRKLGRPVTFRDLAGRWAVDRRYHRTIASVADRFRKSHCSGRQRIEEARAPREDRAASAGAVRSDAGAGMASASALGASTFATQAGLLRPPRQVQRPVACKVFTASYGGTRNVLIRHRVGPEVHYTALQVLDGREVGLAQTFISKHAPGGEPMAQYADRQEALAHAFSLCPSAAGRS